MSIKHEYIPTIIQILLMIFIQTRLYKITFVKERSIRLVFFFFATVAFVLSDLYWLVYDLLYPMTRLPFAANEIGECAVFLSLAAAIALSTDFFTPPAVGETIVAVLFVIANVALWIAWSGEWIQDIITGIVVSYFIVKVIKHIKMTGALSPLAWKILGLICFLVIAANSATFYVVEPTKKMCERGAYIMMLAVDLYFIIRAILSLKKNETGIAVSLSFIALGWTVLFMYMSEGLIYFVANLICSVTIWLMYCAFRKEPVS